MSNNPLDDMFKRFSGTLPEPLRKIQADIEQNSREMLENMLQKMNLVTREEFDVQSAVLQRTREKLEVLEQQVAALEQQLLTPAAASGKKTENTGDEQ